MGRISRFLFLIVLVGLMGAMAYIAVTDLPAPQKMITQKISYEE